MNPDQFGQFVQTFGKDILRFCRITAGNREVGDELYQDTMLKLLEKRNTLDLSQNAKSFALSTAILLWRNRRKKAAVRMRLLPMESMDELSDDGKEPPCQTQESSPEEIYLRQDEIKMVQRVVAALPEKYRVPIYLYYSAGTQIREIAGILHLPEGTVKSRMRKAKNLLKKELEAIGYDR